MNLAGEICPIALRRASRHDPRPKVCADVAEASRREGLERRDISDQEILERLTYPMINEGAKILEEGIAIRPSDIDVIWAYGYGWPTYRGGPMFYADTVGLGHVRDRLCELETRHGESFKPSALLDQMVARGQRFQDWDDAPPVGHAESPGQRQVS